MSEPWVAVNVVGRHLGVVKETEYRWSEPRSVAALHLGRFEGTHEPHA